jgi:hypothetical protein
MGCSKEEEVVADHMVPVSNVGIFYLQRCCGKKVKAMLPM